MKIFITEDRMNGILPDNIKDTKVLTPTAKKVLAYIMNGYYSLSMADENGYFFRTNNEMRKDLRIGMPNMMEAIQELIDTNLIVRKSGETLPNGKRLASKYYVQWDNLESPVVKPTASELIKRYASKKDVSNTKVHISPTVNVKVEIPTSIHLDGGLDYTFEPNERDYDELKNQCSTMTDDELDEAIESKMREIQTKKGIVKNTTTEKEKNDEEYWVHKLSWQKKYMEDELAKRKGGNV